MVNDRDVTGPHFAWVPVRTLDGLIWLKSYWTSGFLNFADETEAMEHWPSSCSEWQLSEGKLIRNYTFYGVTPPEPSTSLKIEFYISKAPSGYIHTRLSFYLRPYLYLLPDRGPFPDNYVIPQFRLGFFGGTGAGTKASPALLAGIFELSFFPADECPPGSGDDMAALEMNRTKDVVACVAVLSSGKPITFTIIEAEGGMSIKLRLQLPNDQERRFQQLYGNLQNAV
jgi:hypothetical protein